MQKLSLFEVGQQKPTYDQSIQHTPNSSYDTLSKKYDCNKNNQIRFIAYQKALNVIVLNGHGKTNNIAVNIASDLIYATLNNRLDTDGYFKIRYKYYADEYGKSDQTIRRAVNLLRDIEIVEKEQRSYNHIKTHCANAIHLKLNVEKLLKVAPTLMSSLSKYLYKMEVPSYQNDTIILSKCRDVDNTSNTLNKDNLDIKSKESEVLNFIKEEKEREKVATSTDMSNTSLNATAASHETCNLMKFYPICQRVADEINKRAGRSFSMRFMNMRIERLNESYKGTNKAVFKNEYAFIDYMRKLFRGEKIQEFVANRLDFEFRKRTVKGATNSEPQQATEVKYTDIDQSTTFGKIQASSFACYGEGVYKSWFQKSTILWLSETSKEIVIECKSGFTAGYIKQHYYKAIEASCKVEDSRWWKVDGTKLTIPIKEEAAENDSNTSVTLKSAMKLEEKCEDIAVNSSVLFTESSDEATKAIEMLEEVKVFKAHNTEPIIKMPHSLLNFVRNVDYEKVQGEYLNNKLCINEGKQGEDEILASIAEKLNEKYIKQNSDTISDEERAHMYSIRLMKSFN